MKWLSKRPLGTIILQRLFMEPLRVLLNSHWTVSADKFDAIQEVKLLDDILSGVAPRREYRVTMAAECFIEGKCLKKLSFLQNEPDMWQMIPLHDHNVSMRCLAFRLHSRIGCLVAVLLVHKHRSMPIAIFLLINHPEKAHEFSVFANLSPYQIHSRLACKISKLVRPRVSCSFDVKGKADLH